MPHEPHSKGVQLCALWLNETKDGRQYYRGKLGDAQLLGWIQTEKSSERAPDLRLTLYPDVQARAHRSKPESPAPTKNGDPANDDIPY